MRSPQAWPWDWPWAWGRGLGGPGAGRSGHSDDHDRVLDSLGEALTTIALVAAALKAANTEKSVHYVAKPIAGRSVVITASTSASPGTRRE